MFDMLQLVAKPRARLMGDLVDVMIELSQR
jgi:hypothetical protein